MEGDTSHSRKNAPNHLSNRPASPENSRKATQAVPLTQDPASKNLYPSPFISAKFEETPPQKNTIGTHGGHCAIRPRQFEPQQVNLMMNSVQPQFLEVEGVNSNNQHPPTETGLNNLQPSRIWK